MMESNKLGSIEVIFAVGIRKRLIPMDRWVIGSLCLSKLDNWPDIYSFRLNVQQKHQGFFLEFGRYILNMCRPITADRIFGFNILLFGYYYWMAYVYYCEVPFVQINWSIRLMPLLNRFNSVLVVSIFVSVDLIFRPVFTFQHYLLYADIAKTNEHNNVLFSLFKAIKFLKRKSS